MAVDFDVDDGIAWGDFVASRAQLSNEQISLFATVDERDSETRRWALSVLGLSGAQLIEALGCKGDASQRETAAAFLSDLEALRRRSRALVDLMDAAALRVTLAMCDKGGCHPLRSAACRHSRCSCA
jgi:hypothetical protein